MNLATALAALMLLTVPAAAQTAEERQYHADYAAMMVQLAASIEANTESIRDDRELQALQHVNLKNELRTEAIYWLLTLLGFVFVGLLISLKQLVALLFEHQERRLQTVLATKGAGTQ